MPHDQMLLTVLGVVVVANALLLALVPLEARRQRRSSQRIQPGRPDRPVTHVARPPASRPSEPHASPSGRGAFRDEEAIRAAAAIEAFVAEAEGDAVVRAHPPTQPQAYLLAPEHNPAGLEGPAAWDRIVREESARHARLGRPVTVVVAELPHLDRVADRLGRDVADRVVSAVAGLLVAEGRPMDRIAWLGDARFGALLLETEETGAGNYVDRVRAAADAWLESAGLSIRLSIALTMAGQGGDLMAAAGRAEQRMHDVVGRSRPNGAPVERGLGA